MAAEVTYLQLSRPPLVCGMPHDVARELDFGFHRAFPRALRLTKDSPIWLRYGTTDDGPFDVEGGIECRELVGWLFAYERRIGMVKLREWRLPPWVSDRDLFDVADAYSRDTYDFAKAVLSAWPVKRLAEYGHLLEVCRVWMAPDQAHGSLWATAINGLIRRRYARDYAVMLLNTYPQDYKADSIDVDAWRGRHRWNRRRSALARLAQRELGVRQMPQGCPEDDAWWQWRPLQAGVPEPRKRRLSWL